MATTNDNSQRGPSGGSGRAGKKPRADYNDDGKINKKDLEYQAFDEDRDGKLDKGEQRAYKKSQREDLNRDRLEGDLMNSEFAWAWKVIKMNPELKELWDKAISQGWQASRFQAALMNSDWFQENDGYKRTIEALERTDPATYQRRLESAMSKVKDDLIEMGIAAEALAPEKLRWLGRKFLVLGFDQGRNVESYNDWLGSTFVGFRAPTSDATTPPGDGTDGADIGGSALVNQNSLNALLLANGFDPNSKSWQSYVSNAVDKIALKDMTIDDARSFIREQAATLYPVFSDRILQGQNVQDIAAAYFQIYADTLELSPNEIRLTDPYMRSALQDVNKETGKPQAMSLWDFQKILRQDERFQYTKQANQAADGLAANILSMFGFVG